MGLPYLKTIRALRCKKSQQTKMFHVKGYLMLHQLFLIPYGKKRKHEMLFFVLCYIRGIAQNSLQYLSTWAALSSSFMQPNCITDTSWIPFPFIAPSWLSLTVLTPLRKFNLYVISAQSLIQDLKSSGGFMVDLAFHLFEVDEISTMMKEFV